MTAHKDPQARTDEIVEAALEVLEQGGLSALTMEAVIARTALSKGGVYRFFGNRDALLREIYRRIVAGFEPVSKREALSWGLPVKETLLALLYATFAREDGLRLRRVHMRLMPELPAEDPLSLEFRERLDRIQSRYGEIVFAIIKRDRLATRRGHRKTIRSALAIGQSLFDGLVMNSLGGLPDRELHARMSAFIDLVLVASLENRP